MDTRLADAAAAAAAAAAATLFAPTGAASVIIAVMCHRQNVLPRNLVVRFSHVGSRSAEVKRTARCLNGPGFEFYVPTVFPWFIHGAQFIHPLK